MKPLSLISVLLSCLLIGSCEERQIKSKISEDFKETKPLSARDSVNLQAYGILNPIYIAADNDSLWITGEGLSTSTLFLLTGKGEYVAQGINIGNGPNEVLEISPIHRVQNATYIYDGRSGKTGEIQRKDSTLWIVPQAIQKRLYDNLVPLPQGIYLALPVTEGYSYALLDKDGAILDSLAYYPPKPEKASDFTHKLACTGKLAVSKDGKHFARALAYDGGLDFFSISDTSSLQHVSRYERFAMDYDIVDAGQPVPTLSPTTRTGFPYITASAQKFYALYSEEQAVNNPTRSANDICSFGLKGQALCHYSLDRKVEIIAVSPNDSVLYAIGNAIGQEESVYLFLYSL